MSLLIFFNTGVYKYPSFSSGFSTGFPSKTTFTLPTGTADHDYPAFHIIGTVPANLIRFGHTPVGSGGLKTLAAAKGIYSVGGNAAVLAIGTPTDTGAYALTGSTATFNVGLPTTTGAYSVAGTASLLKTWTVAANTGTYTVAGSAITPKIGMPTTTGAYALAGSAVTLSLGVPTSTGTYAIAGSAATPKIGVPTTTGTYAIAGSAVTPQIGVPTTTGTYAVASAGPVLGVGVPVTTGAYTITGSTASLAHADKLTILPGQFVIGAASPFLTYTFPAFPFAALVTENRVAQAAPAVGVIADEVFPPPATATTLTSRVLATATGAFTVTGSDATLAKSGANSFTLSANTGTYTVTPSAINLGIGMPTVSGAFTIAGSTATPGIGMPTTTGAFTIAGSAVTPSIGVPTTTGAYAIAGSAVTLGIGMPTTTGAYVLAGSTVTELATRKLSANTGTYAVTPSAINLNVGMPTATGTYAIAGSAVTLSLTMPVTTGAYLVTGSAITLAATRKLSTATGAYLVSGSTVTETATRALSTTTGAYAISGNTGIGVGMPTATGAYVVASSGADLVKQTSGQFTLATATGAYSIAGSAVVLGVGMPVTTGVYLESTGTIGIGLGVPTSTGIYAISGSASLIAARRMATATSAYTLVGSAATLGIGVTLNTGTYSVTGSAITLRKVSLLSTATAPYTITGAVVGLGLGMPAVTGAYTITGSAGVVATRKLAAATSAYIINGSDTLLESSGQRVLSANTGAFTVTTPVVTLAYTQIIKPAPAELPTIHEAVPAPGAGGGGFFSDTYTVPIHEGRRQKYQVETDTGRFELEGHQSHPRKRGKPRRHRALRVHSGDFSVNTADIRTLAHRALMGDVPVAAEPPAAEFALTAPTVSPDKQFWVEPATFTTSGEAALAAHRVLSAETGDTRVAASEIIDYKKHLELKPLAAAFAITGEADLQTQRALLAELADYSLALGQVEYHHRHELDLDPSDYEISSGGASATRQLLFTIPSDIIVTAFNPAALQVERQAEVAAIDLVIASRGAAMRKGGFDFTAMDNDFLLSGI